MYNCGFLTSSEWHIVTVTVVADMHQYYAYNEHIVHVTFTIILVV